MSLKDDEIEIQRIYRHTNSSTRPGGQQAGMPETCIILTHEETGTVIKICGRESDHRKIIIAKEMLEWRLSSNRY